ncbi:hypothetical protein Nepgr_000433 [Nepenthes gracilis]|uniref:Uncharacterized protein n=1 Tax=Nepenthes gracilis TaxID=150966 RepID=A0AAD3RW82_NEPGR|nr:hypothetical protein Nepgr_000433 [Nepenthes gracilis]
MDVELHKAVATHEDDVDGFISVLERVSTEKGYSLSDIFRQVSPSWNTLLHVAANHDNLGIMQLIVPYCPSVIIEQNSNSDIALHVAPGFGHQFVVQTLLSFWFQGDRVDRRAILEWTREVTEITDDLKLPRVRN